MNEEQENKIYNVKAPFKVRFAAAMMRIFGVFYLIFTVVYIEVLIQKEFIMNKGNPDIFSFILMLIFMYAILLTLGIVSLKAAKAYEKERKKWGQVWGLVLGILWLYIIVGIILLIPLFSKESNDWILKKNKQRTDEN